MVNYTNELFTTLAKGLSLIILVCSTSLIYAQELDVEISGSEYSTCGQTQALTVTLTNNSGVTLTNDAFVMSFSDPDFFALSNFMQTSGDPLSIDVSGFILTTEANDIEDGEVISFIFELEALCDAQNVNTPILEVTFSSDQTILGPELIDVFNIAFGDLSINSNGIIGNLRPMQNIFDAILGIPDTIKVPVTNAGQGTLDSILYKINDPSSLGLCAIVVNGMDVGPPIATVGNDSYFLIGGSAFNATFGVTSNGDDFLDFNESIYVCEVWKGEDCLETDPIIRSAAYGCEDDPLGICQESNVVQTGVSFDFALPDLVGQIDNTCTLRPACYSEQNTEVGIIITNNGTGIARDVIVDLWQGGSNGAIISSTIVAVHENGTIIPTIILTSTDTDGSQACSAAAGNIKGAEVSFNEVFLYPGETMKVTWELNHGCDCRACDINNIYNTNVRDISWTDLCDREFVNNSDISFPEFDANLVGFFEGESFATGSQSCATFQITSGSSTWMNGTYSSEYPDAYFEVEITMDCGLDFSNLTFINSDGVSVPAASTTVLNEDSNTIGDDSNIALIQIDRNVAGTFEICFDTDCGEKPGAACPVTSGFTMTNYFVPEPSCAASCRANVSCETEYSMVFNCGICPPCDGLTSLELEIKRTNYGFLDADDDQVADGTALANCDSPGIKNKRFLAGDTLKLTGVAVVNDDADAPNPHVWDYAFLELDVLTEQYSILGGDFRVWDDSEAAYKECGALFQFGADEVFVTDLSIPSMVNLGCNDFDGYQYAQGDSLFICLYFSPKEALVGEQSETLVYQPEWYLSDVAEYDVDQDACNFLIETLNQIGYSTDDQISIGGRDFGGCEESPFSARHTIYYGSLGFDEFCNEVRNPGIPELYTFQKPDEFQFCPDGFRFRARKYIGTDQDIFDVMIPAAFLNFDGNNVSFFAKSYIETLGTINVDEGIRYFFEPCIQGNCMSIADTYESCISMTYDVDDYVFCVDNIDFGETCENWDYTGGPILEVNVTTPEVELVEPGGCARLQITNVTNIPSPFSFLHIDDITGGFVVTDLVLDPDGSNTPVPMTPLGIYELGDFPAGETVEIEVCGNVTECILQTLAFTAGWDCVSYPTTVEEAICASPSFANFVTVPGDIDANLIAPPGNISVGLCEPVEFIYSVTSTQLGNIGNINIEFQLPNGLNYEIGSFEIAYPIVPSPVYVPVPDPDNPFDNFFMTQVSDYDPVLSTEGLIGSPGAPELLNQVYVRFMATTDCSYVSGRRPSFAAYGYDACGDKTRKVKTLGGRILIDNAVPEYEIDITLGELTLNPCNNDQANVDFDLTVEADPGIMTEMGDSIYVILPEGVSYIGGTYSATNGNASNLDPDIIFNNGQATLKWAITPGLENGDQVIFELDVEAVDVGQACDQYNIVVQTISTMNANCGADICSVGVLSGEENVLINIEKPELQITEVDFNLVSDPPGSQIIEYDVSIFNNGNAIQDESADIILELWNDVDANGFLDMNIDMLAVSIQLNETIMPGGSISISGEQLEAAGTICKLLAVLNPETTCTCELSVSNQINTTIENVFEQEVNICSNSDFEIGPESIPGMDFEWLSVNGSNLAALSSTNTTPTTFNFGNTSGSDISWKFALRSSFGMCYSFDTIEITLHPEMMDVVSLSACTDSAFVLPGPVDGNMFSWTPADNIAQPDTNFPMLDPVPAGLSQYMLEYIDANGCTASKVINVNGIGCAPNTGIGDTVWFDINEDGFQDNNELGIPDVTVFLYNANNTSAGNHISATATDADGYYSFLGLPAGNYVVGFINPDGFVVTLQDQGTTMMEDSLDSDPNANGLTGAYFLPNGEFNPTVDAGFIPDCLLDIQIADITDCQETSGGLGRVVTIDISWENAVYTYDFLNGSETIEYSIFGEDFSFEIFELSGDTSFTYELVSMDNSIDLFVDANMVIDDDCIASDDSLGIVGCIYDMALIKDLPFLPSIKYGDILPFEIIVENQGAHPMTNIKINDFKPEGFGFDQSLNLDWMESATDTLMYLITDTLMPGEQLTIPLNLELLMSSGGTDSWLNQAEIFSMMDTLGNDRSNDDIDSTPDGDPTNDAGGIYNTGSDDSLMGDGTGPLDSTNPNTDEDDQDPEYVRVIDLALIKEIVTPGPYNYGDEIEFMITVGNQGGETVQNIAISDYIPMGFAWLGTNLPEWVLNGSVATDTLEGPLVPGQDTSVSIILELQMAAPDQYVNIAEISYFENEDGDDISSDDIDSVADEIADNDGGGNPGSDADDTIGGDGTGAMGDSDAETDEDDSDPAYIPVPLIDVEKSTISIVPASSGTDGNFDVTFEFEITNPGNQKLTCIQLEDDLVEQLGSSFVGLVNDPIIADLTDASEVPIIVMGYNGAVIDTIFNGTDGCLDVGQTITIQLQVELTSLTGPDPVINEAMVTAKDSFDTQVMAMDTALVELPDCFLSVVCPQTEVSLSCLADLPSAGNTVAWFNALDEVSLISNSCGMPTVTVVDSDIVGVGCAGDPYMLTRTITINDPGDGTSPADSEVCIVIYTISDEETPEITCPGSLIAECSASNIPVYADMNAFIAAGGTLSDNCGIQSFTFVSDVSDGNTCPETITRTYSVTDNCGNTSMCSQFIIVNDQTAPVMDCPEIESDCTIGDIPAYANFAEFMMDGNNATDNCGIVEGSFMLIEESTDGKTCPTIYVRKYQIMDMCGNVGFSTQTITLDDETAPTFDADIPIDVTINCDETVPDAALITATDNCGAATVEVIETSNQSNSGDCSDYAYQVQRIYRAFDACQNEVRDTQYISVVDNTNPTPFCCTDFVLELDENGQANLDPSDINCGSFDNCSPMSDLSFDLSQTSFNESDIGTNIITMIVSDACGNSASCTTTVTISGSSLIGIAKRITDVDYLDDGCVEITYELNVQNYGNTELTNLSITDDLDDTFVDCDNYEVDEISSDDFLVNPAYSGNVGSNMLLGLDTLQAGDKGAVLLTAKACGCGDATVENKATVNADSPEGPISDDSTNGSNPDGDGDGDPSNDDEPTNIDLSEEVLMGLAKRVVSAELDADGCTELVYEFNIQNYGTVNINDIQLTDDLDGAGFDACGSYTVTMTSDDFTVNPSFDGSGNMNLLTGADTLHVGDKGAVLLTVNVCGCADGTMISNSATVEGTSPSGADVTDDSDSGSDSDGDGDGDPTNDDDSTDTMLSEDGLIGLAKRVVSAELDADGCTELVYEFNIQNYGTVNINDIQLTDDLDGAGFDACGSYTVTMTSDDFTVNPSFDGSGNMNLLTGADTLHVGDKGAVLLTVNVCGCADGTMISNSATVEGTSPSGADVTDDSDSGSDPDGDGDGDPTNDDDSTDTMLSEDGLMGLAKRVVSAELHADGCTELVYEFNIQNYGTVNINDIQLTDDLDDAGFDACGSYTVTMTSDDFTVNPSFDGSGNMNLLTGADTLHVGDKGAVLLTVNACGCPDGTMISNSATVEGTSPSGADVSDDSDSGSDPDGNGDGDPTNDDDSTDTMLSEDGLMGLAKRVVSAELDADGCTELVYEFNIQNYGTVNINDIQLTDDLDDAGFDACGSYTVTMTSDDFTVNPSFDGSGNMNLLTGADTLHVGDKGAVLLTVNACGCADGTMISNSATVEGTSPSGADVSDDSDSGSDPDGDGDGDPTNDDDSTDTMLSEDGLMGLAKRVVSADLDADGCTELVYEFNIQNYGTVNINDIQLTDDLDGAGFDACGSYTVTMTSDDFTVNPSFDGSGNMNLLTGADTLHVGDKGAVLLTVNACGCADGTMISNSATVEGTSPSGADVTDDSDSGSDPDGDGDGDPSNDDDSTDTMLSEDGLMGLAKRVVSADLDADGCTELVYEFNIQNYGTVNINDIQLIDDLDDAGFDACGSYTVTMTSDDFTVNPSFDGSGNMNLLTGADTLHVGDKGAVLLTVNACGCPDGTMISNSATVEGTSPSGADVSDDSDSGSDPDGDGDGDPTNDDDSTDTMLSEDGEIGLAKRIVNAQENSDGSVDIIYEFNVQNYGDVDLLDLQVVDFVGSVFSPCAVTIEALTSDDFIINPNYNGGNDEFLLVGNDVLEAGDKGAILLHINVKNCNGNSGPFMNTAEASGTTPSGNGVSDVSDNGSDPDGDGDGDPNNDDDTTDITFNFQSFIGLAKNLESIILPGDGSAHVSIRFIIENFGNTDLDSINLFDNVVAQFNPCEVEIMSTVASPGFVVNPLYDGGIISDTILTGPDNDLFVGQAGFVLINYRLTDCGDGNQSFCNQAFVTAVDPTGVTIFDDLSQSGTDPDPDGDNDPTNNDECTSVTFGFNPAIGIAKRVSEGPIAAGNGCFDLTYEIRVENMGDQEIVDVQVADDLTATFMDALSWSVTGLSSEEFMVNPDYDGMLEPNLLLGLDTLVVESGGEEGTINLSVQICPGDELGPYENSAFVNGTSLDGTVLLDQSHDGSNPDPNGDGDATLENDPTPITFSFDPSIGVAKRLVETGFSEDGCTEMVYEFNIENFGDVLLTELNLEDDLIAAGFGDCNSFTTSLTSDDFIINDNFDGDTDIQLLSGTDDLPVAEKGAVLLTVNACGCPDGTQISNNATVNAVSPLGDIEDDSVDGSDPDGEDNDNMPDEVSSTDFEISENGIIGGAKRVVNVENNGDGTFSVVYEINVQNFGDVNLTALQVEDDLSMTFPTPCMVSTQVTSDDFTVNPLYGIADDWNLLDGGDTLHTGDKGAILLEVLVSDCAAFGTFSNTATVSAQTPSGEDIEDVTDDGSDPDPDGEESTDITITNNSSIGLAKRVSEGPSLGDNGCFEFTYEFRVVNYGQTQLTNIQITDDLAAVFTLAQSYEVVSIESEEFTVNTGFNGNSDINLLQSMVDTLNTEAGGESGAIYLTISVCPGDEPGPYLNTSTVTASGPDSDLMDISHNDSNPDPDGDGPENDMDETPITLNLGPEIGAAKRVVSVMNNGDGSYSVIYELNIENSGNVSLSNIQLEDDLSVPFGGICDVLDVELTSDDFIINTEYDGLIDIELLEGIDDLNPGDKGAVLLTVIFGNCNDTGTFTNQATAYGDTPSGETIEDESTDGSNPDADGDGNPNNDMDPTEFDLDCPAPEWLNCPAPPVVVDAPDTWCSAFANFAQPLAESECGIDTILKVDMTGLDSGDLFPVGTTILKWVAIDVFGNESDTCEIKVVVNDFHTPPAIGCKDDVSQNNDPNQCGALVTNIAPAEFSLEDNCFDNTAILFEVTDESGDFLFCGIEDASGEFFPVGTSTVEYIIVDQPILLITEVLQDGVSEELEITNFGPASYDISCLEINRLGDHPETFIVDDVTVLAPGETFVQAFTPVIAGGAAGYSISFIDNLIDAISLNGYIATEYDWSGVLSGEQVFRHRICDHDDSSDWTIVNTCDLGSMGMLNNGLAVFPDNGTQTSLQGKPASSDACSFDVTIIDDEAAYCAEYDSLTYNAVGFDIMPGVCASATFTVNTSYDVGDVNLPLINMTYPDAGELTVRLTSPSGTSVLLFDRNCSGTADVNIGFDDDVLLTLASVSCGPLGGGLIYQPLESFKAFFGEPALGDWTLEVISDGLSVGSVDAFELEVHDLVAYSQMDTTITTELGLCEREFTWRHPRLADNCCIGNVTLSYYDESGDLIAGGLSIDEGELITETFLLGVTTVEYTLTDGAGNVSTCGFEVTVIDDENPVIDPSSCQDVIVDLDPGQCETLVTFPAFDADDNCGVQSVVYNPSLDYMFPIGTTEVTLTVTDGSGLQSTCTFNVIINEFIPASNELACNNAINLSLGQNCEAILTADMMLEGDIYGCYDSYCITILDEFGNVVGSNQNGTNVFGLEHVGQTFTVEICTSCVEGDNCCWGTVNVEQKLLPLVNCPEDVVIQCNEADDPDITGQPELISCEPDVEITYVDNYLNGGICDNPREIISRVWTIRDQDGNEVICEQTITVMPFDFTEVSFPENYVLDDAYDCQDVTTNPDLTEPENTGYPMINDKPIFGMHFCEVNVGYWDEILIDANCPGSYEILRNWVLRDECKDLEDGLNPLRHIQAIKVNDVIPPNVIDLPEDITVSTDPWDCNATIDINEVMPTFLDDCGDIKEIKVFVAGGSVMENGQGGFTLINIQPGTHEIKVKAIDGCNNFTTVTFNITVVDASEPVAICLGVITTSLTTDGIAKVFAESLDNGSYDNCSDIAFEIYREDTPCGFGEDLTPGEFVKFCCEDIANSPIKTVLRIWDDADNDGTFGSIGDNYAECWVDVIVEDKTATGISCPEDVEITCDQDPTNLNLTGAPSLTSLCDFAEADYEDDISGLNQCGIGTIYRTWQVEGENTECVQEITIIAVNVLTEAGIMWPSNYEGNCLDEIPDTEPGFVSQVCDQVGINMESDTFHIDGDACYKIVNEWTIIDWCQFEEDPDTGVFRHTQVIAIKDDIAPTITACGEHTFDKINEDCVLEELVLVNTAEDNDCGFDLPLSWYYQVDFHSDGTINLSGTTMNDDAEISIYNVAIGTHTVHWVVSDGCGNQSTCSQTYIVEDGVAPLAYCGSFSTSLDESGMVMVWATDFDLGGEDSCSDWLVSFDSLGTQMAMPFGCEDIENGVVAMIDVDIYYTDANGNQTKCITQLTISDNHDNCADDNSTLGQIHGKVMTEMGLPNNHVTIMVENMETVDTVMSQTGLEGEYDFEAQFNYGESFRITAEKEDHFLNGVSSLDLLLIQKHILGLQALDSPYKIIAADVDNSESISAVDLINLRKIILGIISEVESDDSWRFVDADQIFNDIYNPWPVSYSRMIDPMAASMMDEDFIAVKTGDVNENADPSNLGMNLSTPRSGNVTSMLITERVLSEGEIYELPLTLTSDSKVQAFQGTFNVNTDLVELIAVDANMPGMGSDHFGIQKMNSEGLVSFVWTNENGVEIDPSHVINLTLKAKESVSVSEVLYLTNDITPTVSYIETNEGDVIDRSMKLVFEQNEFEFDIAQNVPNPFVDQTSIPVMMPESGVIELVITDMLSKVVFRQNYELEQGQNVIDISRDLLGHTGVYYYDLTYNDIRKTKKMILIK